ncbi:hypothetical protein EDD28_1506 [Salana multivorans]|uniref:Uncharacterized protein n=1 Tax=Salana multivorans TaxID=120377 RepID=A0A3N2DAY9_9MICO|nr:hypothetical protein [Salana multivorans]MBN8882911.1 hypothetical protein [Salana multivorans]ROR96913.1 hypothetical protein EDD28_1506 [Salana multivorans]
MCQKVTCRQCGLATWSGCGNHVEQALRGVPTSQRCRGHAEEPRTGFLARLLGR